MKCSELPYGLGHEDCKQNVIASVAVVQIQFKNEKKKYQRGKWFSFVVFL